MSNNASQTERDREAGGCAGVGKRQEVSTRLCRDPPSVLVTLTPGPARVTSVHAPCSSCYTLGSFSWGGVGGLPTQRPRALGAPRAPGAHALGTHTCCPPSWFRSEGGIKKRGQRGKFTKALSTRRFEACGRRWCSRERQDFSDDKEERKWILPRTVAGPLAGS